MIDRKTWLKIYKEMQLKEIGSFYEYSVYEQKGICIGMLEELGTERERLTD